MFIFTTGAQAKHVTVQIIDTVFTWFQRVIPVIKYSAFVMELTGDSLKATIQCPDFEVVHSAQFCALKQHKEAEAGGGLLFFMY